MQPKNTKIALIIGALFLGASGASQADVFPVSAGAIPDVDIAFVSGFTELSFGEGVIGNRVGDSCSMDGISGINEDVLLHDINEDGVLDQPDTLGDLTGAACVAGTGSAMLIEIDGAAGATVTVSVPDVVGPEGYTYTPTAESCVIDFDGGTTDALDPCVSLATNTVTGVGMSGDQTTGAVTNEIDDAADGYPAIEGKTRLLLAGSITIDSEIPAGTTIAADVLVQVTYE